ncbi:TPA: hypothetical protein ACXNQV_000252 [Stenotrophomonas maltophilia]|uniref:hypothetical protein n=1 Tax=Stenotrophomonas maltophilia TaxID=40324 RepID=UPI0021D87A4F|nr:hypothetical protein [Stenotrophomonas maltophilia]UXY48402.1 hypothetical protein N8888_00165 [Stenotrophomonas maltophilia]
MSTVVRTKSARGWGLAAMMLLAVAACREPGSDPARPAAEPVAAVQAMAQRLAEDDLLGYAKLSVPPSQYQRLQQAWADGHSQWPLTELPLGDQLLPMLAALRRPGASAELQRSFDRQLAGQSGAVRQAAQSMGNFGVQYLRHQKGYTPSQQAHYIALVEALSGWAQGAPISDRARARSSIAALVGAATQVGFEDDAGLQAAGMEGSLQQLAPFIHTLKAVLASYGLGVDEALLSIRGEVLSLEGDNALVRLQYDLAGRELTLQLPLSRREGHWYLTRTLADTDAILRQADAARAAAAPAPAEPADAGEEAAMPPPKP